MLKSSGLDLPDLFADPFLEHGQRLRREPVYALGARFTFESNDERLLRLVDAAYEQLPRHRLGRKTPTLRVVLCALPEARSHRRLEPEGFEMLSGGGLLGGCTASSCFVTISAADRAALVGVPVRMLDFPYHTRYEVIEFAAFTLAVRVQGLVPLHAACVSVGGRAALLMGESGSGKSTVGLQCLMNGVDFVSEDSAFVEPTTLRVTGVSNFMHVRSDSLRWVTRAQAATIRESPVIRRRSGVRKFEVDLRNGDYRLAKAAPRLKSVVFLSPQSAEGPALLQSLSRHELLARLGALQPYAVGQAHWKKFARAVASLGGFELRRGRHPVESVDALRAMLSSSSSAAGRNGET
ncbi:MAG TPA: hypothetical protein VGM84_01720 [Steroidobacteraceae bacterium]